jgi:hypothetical protein
MKSSRNTLPLETRFWNGILKTDGCWQWLGPYLNSGYGYIWHSGKTKPIHRASWEIHYGEIPDGLDICHKCDNRKCANPEHLFIGTRSDNLRDSVRKGRYRPNPVKGKLTLEDVQFIRQHYVYGNTKELMRKFNVCKCTIRRVVHHRNRKVAGW